MHKFVIAGGIGFGLLVLLLWLDKHNKNVDESKYSAESEPDADYERQLDAGREVEKEHQATYEYMKYTLESTGKLPTPDKFFSSIAKDHISEIDDYYIPWLRDMETNAKAGELQTYSALPGSELIEKGKAKISGKVKITKAQLKELASYAKDVPNPKGWDTYFNKKLKPRLTKVIKVVQGGVLLSAGGPLGIPLLIANKKYKWFKGIDDKTANMVIKLVREGFGRFITITKMYIVSGNDITDTLKALKAKQYNALDVNMPSASINWDKVDEDKLFTAAMFFADDAVPVATATVAVATSETGVGAVVGGGATGVTGAVTAGTDVMAFKMIADAISPAIDIKNQ